MLGAVDASGVKLVHDLCLGDFVESERSEKFRGKGEYNIFGRCDWHCLCNNGFDECLADAFSAVFDPYRHRLNLHSGCFFIAYFRMNLVCCASNDFFSDAGNDEAVGIFNDIAERLRYQLIAVEMNELEDVLGIFELCSSDGKVCFHDEILYHFLDFSWQICHSVWEALSKCCRREREQNFKE